MRGGAGRGEVEPVAVGAVVDVLKVHTGAEEHAGAVRLRVGGRWTIETAVPLRRQISGMRLRAVEGGRVEFDGSGLTGLDSVGALLLSQLQNLQVGASPLRGRRRTF